MVEHGKPNPSASPEAPTGASVLAQDEPLDSQLIDAVLAGDSSAFGQLVIRYQDRLCNALARFTGSADDAQDIAQDAFVQAYTKLDRFRRDSAFYTWLYRIAFNRAVSVSRKKRERASIDAENAAEPVSGAAPPDSPVMAQENVELVHRALAELNEDHRQVLVLREFDGLDYQQIAEALEVAVGTVRSRLSRARIQLREVLTKLGLAGELGVDAPGAE